MSELKPCHLCGGTELNQSWQDGYQIYCLNCELTYQPSRLGNSVNPDEKLVAFAWNNRGKHPQDCIDPHEENERLRFMIDNGLGWEDMKGGNIEDVS